MLTCLLLYRLDSTKSDAVCMDQTMRRRSSAVFSSLLLHLWTYGDSDIEIHASFRNLLISMWSRNLGTLRDDCFFSFFFLIKQSSWEHCLGLKILFLAFTLLNGSFAECALIRAVSLFFPLLSFHYCLLCWICIMFTVVPIIAASNKVPHCQASLVQVWFMT